MQPYYGPPASSIPMQPLSSGSSRLLGTATHFMQPTASMASAPIQHAVSGASRGGGILARLLGGGRITSQALGSASGGLNFATILENTQRVMGITQQVAPMIQQYGPFVKNVPTLWRMMRSMRQPSSGQQMQTSAESTTARSDQASNQQADGIQNETPVLDRPSNQSIANTTSATKQKQQPSGESLPKLYI
ncbi:VrrA/YqfQ family protein [Bacillus sp. Marseille-P3800]|uniref:VrrA/YqfQ family protein n=1 Tax=Bacillus sp. Marseille-P3800 TaxID=2014782 RepID=UPI000C07C9FF|nr:VrrA/YqfQ family protein [Bacillus sp. Marseille-P3800]